MKLFMSSVEFLSWFMTFADIMTRPGMCPPKAYQNAGNGVSILESSILAPQIKNNPVSHPGAMAWSATGDIVVGVFSPQRKSPKLSLLMLWPVKVP